MSDASRARRRRHRRRRPGRADRRHERCAARGVESVLVLEREAHAGGIPRHSDHTGYGLRDLRTVHDRPRLRSAARRRRAGRRCRRCAPSAMVTGWDGDRALHGHEPGGSGADRRAGGDPRHRRARTATHGPSDSRATGPPACSPPASCRTSSTCSTRPSGDRAVIVGAELVSWSAVLTLREAGCSTALDDHGARPAGVVRGVLDPGRLGLGVPVRPPHGGRPHHRQGPRDGRWSCVTCDTGARRDVRLRHRGVHR